MNPLSLLRGDTLGKTLYNYAVAILVVVAIAWGGWTVAKGKFWHWRADTQSARADRAEANAATAQTNATNATGAAVNATQTRAAMDTGTNTARTNTAEAVKRINAHVPTPVAASGVPDPDLVRELRAAHDRARSAADRL
jgi:hypothetical protein